MLLESFVSVALAVIVSGAPATCPTSGTWLQGTDAKNNAVCCPSPVVTGGICSVALSDVGRGMITCGVSASNSVAGITFTFMVNSTTDPAVLSLDVQLGGAKGSDHSRDVSADLTVTSQCPSSGCVGGYGANLRALVYPYDQIPFVGLTFNVSVGTGLGGSYTAFTVQDGSNVEVIAGGGGAASGYGDGAVGGSDQSVTYNVVVLPESPQGCNCPSISLGFNNGLRNGVVGDNESGADGGSGLIGGMEGSSSCSCTAGGPLTYSGGGGGENQMDADGFFVSSVSTQVQAFASVTYESNACQCANGYVASEDYSACCIALATDGTCASAVETPTPSNSATSATPNNTASNTTPTSSNTPSVSSNTPATPISITPITPGTGTPTTSADADCPTCVDYAPPAIISPTVKTAVAQGATASNLVISGASSLSIQFATVCAALSCFVYVV